MALTDLTRISTSGIATGSTIDSPILRKDVDFRGDEVGVTSALFDSSGNELNLKNDVKLTFGNAGTSDSQFYFDSNNLILQETSASGSMLLRGQNIRLQNPSQSNENYIECLGNNTDRRVKIYQGATTRFETTSTGAVVTGILTATSFSGGISGDTIGNVYAASGISTFYDLRVSNNLTVQGTTTTLDTNLIGVDRVEVGADSDTIVGVAVTQSGAADLVNLFDGTSQVVTIDDEGNVGLGTDNPDRMLHILGTGNAIVKMEANYSGSVTGIEGVLTASGANRYVTGVYGKVVNTSGTESNVASIRLWNQQASPTTSDSPGYITFNTTNDSASTATEKVRITSGGNVNIGTGETTQTARMLNVYGGATRVTQTSGGNTVEVFGHTTSGQSYGLLVNAGSTSGDYCANFRNSSGTALFRIRGDGFVGVGTDTPNSALPLTIAGQYPGIQFKDTDGTTSFNINADDGIFRIQTGVAGAGPSPKLNINSDGDVLINTITTPTADIKLLVNGNGGVSSGNFFSFRGEYANIPEPAAYAIKYDSSATHLSGAGGLHQYAYGGIAFNLGGQDRVNFTTTGSVGIGTTNPSSGKLQVQDGGIAVRGAATPNINFSPTDGNSGNADISFDGNDLKIISNSSGADIRIAAYSKDNHIVIRPNGRVGIGTDDPVTTLDVHGNVAVDYNATHALRFYTQPRNNWSSISNTATDSNANLSFKTAQGEAMYMSYSKLVGIGTDDPNKLLEIHATNTNTYSSSISNTPNSNTFLTLTNKAGTDGSGSGYYAAMRFQIASGATSSGWLSYHRTGDNTGAFTFKSRASGSNYPEMVRISSEGNGRVGIKNNLSNTFDSNANTLTIGDGGGAVGLTFYTAASADGSHISFTETTGSTSEGMISYYQGAYGTTNDRDCMVFKANSGEKFRITKHGVTQFRGGYSTSTNSTSTWSTLFTFSDGNTNGFSMVCAVAENSYTTMYRVAGSPYWNSSYFTSDYAGDSQHNHSSDIEFRINNDSGTKSLQFKAVSYTTTRQITVISVWLKNGYAIWA